MSIDRNAAITHLDSQFDVIAAAVGSASVDYGNDVNQAMRRLGVAESNLSSATVEDGDRGAFLALSEYYALKRFASKLALKISMSVNGMGQASEGQMYEHVEELMEKAEKTCAGYGYPVDASSAWSVGSLSLDYIEPEPS